MIRTPDLLFSGEAVNKVFSRCMPQILKPLDLLAKDVDFLLIVLRKVTYGDEMELIYTHDCKDAEEHSYVVNLAELIRKSIRINPTSVENIYKETLPNDQIVELRPTTYGNIIKMLQSFDPKRTITPEVEEQNLIETVMSIIESVDGITDQDKISEWLKVIKSKWINQLKGAIEKTSDWGPSFTADKKCKDCKKNIKIEVPANPISFFS